MSNKDLMMTSDRGFEAQKPAPSLVIPLVMYDNVDYIKWLGTAESKVWHKMYRHVVRGRMTTKLNIKLHKDYYKKGILTMHKDLQNIADFLGLKSKGYISEVIKSMETKGILKIHEDVWYRRQIKVYELGTHDGSINRYETLHLFNYFVKMKAEKDLANLID